MGQTVTVINLADPYVADGISLRSLSAAASGTIGTRPMRDLRDVGIVRGGRQTRPQLIW